MFESLPATTPFMLMQEIPDSVGLRQRIQNQFELAALPGTSEEDMKTALHFVVVGGGPTGVLLAQAACLHALNACSICLGCSAALRLALFLPAHLRPPLLVHTWPTQAWSLRAR